MTENYNAVDFADPDSVAAALADSEPVVAAEKKKKESKPRTITVTFIADHDIAAGETVSFPYEVPKSGARGVLVGLSLGEMSDDQLKIEYRNANSVAYKTKKAGRDASKAVERLEACKAEMEKRGIQPTARGTAQVDAKSVAELITAGKISVEDIQKYLDDAAE